MTDVKECPECSNTIAVNTGYLTWCDKCNWNIKPQETKSPKKVWERFYERMSAKYSNALFHDVLRRSSLKPEGDIVKTFGYIFAAFVLLLPLIFFLSGIYLLVALWPNIFAIFTAIVFFGITFIMRPRINEMPKNILPRDKFPALYEYSDAICRHLGCAPLDGIVISNDYNAFMGNYGFKRKKIMTIGLAIWAFHQKNDEKSALLSHEIAHNVNGDPNRNFVVGYAVDTLHTMYYLMWPDELWPVDAGVLGLGAVPFNIALRGLAYIPLFGANLLLHIFWQNSQRAEYYADYLSTKVSGADAAIRSLQLHYYGNTFRQALHVKALNPKSHADLFTLALEKFRDVPPREIERLARIDRIELNRVGVTHPPTWHRIEFLKARSIEGEELQLPDELFERIEQELEPFYKKNGEQLVLEYHDSLYCR